MRLRHICSAMLLSLVSLSGFAQTGRSGIEIDYTNHKKYTVAGVDVEGNTYFGSQQIVNLTGLQKGMEVTIPSDEMSSIVDRVWAQRFFEDVGIVVDSLNAAQDSVWLKQSSSLKLDLRVGQALLSRCKLKTNGKHIYTW